jgi:phosphoribosyl-AMP cyclohydrolase
MRHDILTAVRFNEAGLIPAIAQQHDSHEVLMLAWMNAESILETLKTGEVCYYSRSRGSLWRKGETSGHTQKLVEMRLDCDGDTVLLRVDQTGPACHTGNPNCFFQAVGAGGELTQI